MKKIFFLLFFEIFCLKILAQNKVRFVVQELSYPKHDSIYIAGTFNNWDEGNKRYELQTLDTGHKSIVLNLPDGKIEYKFTRGKWLTVEKDLDCQEMQNREATIKHDTTINLNIENWKDLCLLVDNSIPALQKGLQTQKEDSNKVIILNRLGVAVITSDDKSAMQYLVQALSLSEKIGFARGKAKAYRIMGIIYLNKYNYSEGRKDLFISLKLYKEINEKMEASYVSEDIGNSYLREGLYAEALNYFYFTLSENENLGDKTSTARTHKNIAEIYVQQGNNSEALKEYSKALVAFQESWLSYKEDWMRLAAADCENSIASIYLKVGQISEALKNDSLALKIYMESNSQEYIVQFGMANVLSTFGDIYQKEALSVNTEKGTATHKLREALKKHTEALNIFEKFNNDEGIAESLNSIGFIHLKLDEFVKAKEYLEKSLQTAFAINYKESLKDSYFLLSDLDSTQGNYKQALQYYKTYVLYRDSLVNEESTKKSLQAKMQYETDKKDGQIKLLSAQNQLEVTLTQKQNQQKNFAYVTIAVILLAGVYSFYRFRRKKKLQNQQALMNERLRISTELHDEVGATLSGIAMYSHLTKEQIKKGQTTEIERSLNVMQQSSAQMVDKLSDIVWLINPEQDSLLKLVTRLEEYAADMVAIKNMQVKISVPEKMADINLPVETRRNIYLFCKEAINNAVKYSNASLLELTIKAAEGKLEFLVKDNGKGFDAAMVRRGNGLENMQKRADEIGAKLVLQSKENEGVSISLQCKIT